VRLQEAARVTERDSLERVHRPEHEAFQCLPLSVGKLRGERFETLGERLHRLATRAVVTHALVASARGERPFAASSS